MAVRQIFVNLPVKDLDRSKRFFESLGFSFNPDFTDDQGASLVLGDNIYAMLLVEPFFQTFIAGKAIADAKQHTGVITCVSVDSREEVDAIVAKATAAGARTPNPAKDHGFMYGHGFEDLDGHLWEIVAMQQADAGH